LTFSFSKKINFHQSSTLSIKKGGATPGVPTDWVVYDEIILQGHVNLLKECSSVTTAAVCLFAGNLNERPEICKQFDM